MCVLQHGATYESSSDRQTYRKIKSKKSGRTKDDRNENGLKVKIKQLFWLIINIIILCLPRWHKYIFPFLLEREDFI